MPRVLQAVCLALLLAAALLARAQQNPPPEAPSASRELIAKVAEAFGGMEKLQSLTGMRCRCTVPGMAIDALLIFPDRLHMDVREPMGEFTIVRTPGANFWQVGTQTTDAKPEVLAESTSFFRHTLLYLLHRASDPDFSSSLGGWQKIGDVNAEVLNLNVGGQIIHLFV